METYFKTEDMAVGYDGHILIHDINIRLEKGKILTLIGPNGDHGQLYLYARQQTSGR